MSIVSNNQTRPSTPFVKQAVLAASILAAVSGFCAFYLHRHETVTIPKTLSYNPTGFGGYSANASFTSSNAPKKPEHAASTNSSLKLIQGDYAGGRYQQAEVSAEALIQQNQDRSQKTARESTADAMQVMAYSAARQHDLKLAQARFARLQQYCAMLPDHGAQSAPPGEAAPTLEQEAAFQQAVCTSGLGNKSLAESQFLEFMKQFPESPLLQAAASRIAFMHQGNFPLADMPTWKLAEATAIREHEADLLANAMCGPECLAELIRRDGRSASVSELAAKMQTSDFGTNLAELANAANHEGWQAQGVLLTEKGLSEQHSPVIALLTPGHFVIVDSASPAKGVSFWDPDALGVGHGANRVVNWQKWYHAWRGIALILKPQDKRADAVNDKQIQFGRFI